MTLPVPHYLLFAESRRREWADTRVLQSAGTRTEQLAHDVNASGDQCGQWRFVLEAVNGSAALEVVDDESDGEVERLELLAVIRGLEALDQPSRVTLITRSPYVSHGLRCGLSEWRENGWRWERFGQFVPITNGDLWRRVDHALSFHRVDCRAWRFDGPHETAQRHTATSIRKTPQCVSRQRAAGRAARWLQRLQNNMRNQYARWLSTLRQFVARYPRSNSWAAR